MDLPHPQHPLQRCSPAGRPDLSDEANYQIMGSALVPGHGHYHVEVTVQGDIDPALG